MPDGETLTGGEEDQRTGAHGRSYLEKSRQPRQGTILLPAMYLQVPDQVSDGTPCESLPPAQGSC